MSDDAPLTENRQALADLARLERFHALLAQSLDGGQLARLVLAKPRAGGDDLQRLSARPLQLRGEPCLQLVYHHATRDITKNPPAAEALALVRELLGTRFAHAHLFTTEGEWQLSISKRGKVALARHGQAAPAAAPPGGHDREKQRWLSLDEPFLHDLGVTDAQARLVPAMARKWKQINKFVEVIAHALERAQWAPPAGEPVRVVDFGAGRGYLTFALHHHLTQGRHWPAEVLGVELRQPLVDECNAAAARRGLAGLRFECGDVNDHAPERVDLMIALHACDTATDVAIAAGIRAGATMIVCSPCCHKELRPQMQLPEVLRGMLQHGIHLGQQAEMLTDTLRALWLEASGWDAQVFEFVALEHTSKNKMILALRRPEGAPGEARRRAEARRRIDELKAFYGVQQQRLEALL